jgi:biopolymer transport protein ExbB/TolQ
MPVWLIVIEWLARLILLGLVGLSVWSIAIIIDRRKIFKNLTSESLLNKLKAKTKNAKAKNKEQLISPLLFQEKKQLEQGLNVLGTLGSTTPFIGLLGTILGIIVAFGELSQGKADTNAIMFALAEALILTAVGLFVAIPAVIAFNLFSKKIKNHFDEVSSQFDAYSAEHED